MMNRIEIRVLEGDWGDADLTDIRDVALSVAEALTAHVTLEAPISIVLEPARPSDTTPRTFYERSAKGEIRVRLKIRGRYWADLAFQLGHELGHVLVGARECRDPRQEWIEEAMCQAASSFVLRRMAVTWKTSPPCRNWAPYAEVLREKGTVKAWLPGGPIFFSWLAKEIPTLESKPYQESRASIELVALQLLPVFEKDPAAWNAVRFFDPSPGLDTYSALLEWRDACPPEYRSHVACLAEVMGRPLPAAPQEDRSGDLEKLVDEAMHRALADGGGEQVRALAAAEASRVTAAFNLADVFRGVYQPNVTYRRGELVMSNGTTWLALEDTKAHPGEGTNPWRMFAKAGRPGRDRTR